MRLLLISALVTLIFAACSEEERYVPKRYGQLRIDLDLGEKTYVLNENVCGFATELPDYARVEPKSSPEGSCFADIVIPKHKATINLTYKSVDGNLPDYLNQSNGLVQKHLIKADDFQDTLLLDSERKVFAQVFNLTGDVASPVQFLITDSSNHFIRGSLDFYAKPNYDSILPVLNYVRTDIYHFITHLEWSDE